MTAPSQSLTTWQLLSDCLNVREVMAEHPASTNPARVTCLSMLVNKRQNSKFFSSISFNLIISSESFNYLQTLHNHISFLGIIDENCLDMFEPSFINNLLTILISDGKGSNAR